MCICELKTETFSAAKAIQILVTARESQNFTLGVNFDVKFGLFNVNYTTAYQSWFYWHILVKRYSTSNNGVIRPNHPITLKCSEISQNERIPLTGSYGLLL